MKNIKALTLAFLLSVFGSSYALAEYGVTVGVTGSMAMIDASGTETEGGEKNNGSADNQVGVVSVFAEYTGLVDGFTFGLDWIPMAADVSSKVKKRSDTETSVTDTTTTTSTARTQEAQAELENHLTLYASYAVNESMYVKGGAVMVDLNTLESLGTGSKYGNETVHGVLLGVGFEQEISPTSVGRIELSHTIYEGTSFKSSVARSGVTANNLIDVDLDVTMLKASIGYKF